MMHGRDQYTSLFDRHAGASVVNSDEPSSFGDLLREARLAKGFSQEMLAEQARVSAEAIGALERGRRKTPQRETLALLLDALEPPDPLRARPTAAAIRP